MTTRPCLPALSISLLELASLAGCAGKPVAVAVAPPPPAPVAVAAAMPAGGYPWMAVPAVMADGRYATPNRDLSSAGTIWHLRAALNVAALACRGSEETAIIAGYNQFIARERPALAAAEASYAAEFRAAAPSDWRDRYDDGQTRLYNFFSQTPARDAFCHAAAATLADSADIDAAGLPAFAAGRLAVLEKPFTDFFRAYDAWRADQARAVEPVLATTSVIASAATVAPSPVVPTTPVHPRLELDPSVFADTGAVTH